MVPPLPKGNNPRGRSRANPNNITKLRARPLTGGGARVAIVLPSIATRAACQTIRTSSSSETDRTIRLWKRDESKINLPWTRRADGTPLTLAIEMIAGMIVGAAEVMGLYTSTLKTKVCLVEHMLSRICRAIVVVLILTVHIVNFWCPYARPPLSSPR